MLGVEFEQLVLERRELEEVIFFVDGFGDPSASRAGIAGLRAIDVELIGHAVLAGVGALVDESVVADYAEQVPAHASCGVLRWCG